MDKRHEVHDWGAYIASLVRRYQTPEAARLPLFKPIDKPEQQRFRQLVLNKYGAFQTVDNFQMAWCCISGEWKRAREVTAAHLVPLDSGEANANHVFGDLKGGAAHLLSPENALPLTHNFKEALDSGRITLQPVENSRDIKVMVLEKGQLDSSLRPYHNQLLKFNTNFRPSKRYMYFHLISTILRLQRHKKSEWWREYMNADTHKCWSMAGEGLRKSILTILVQHVGHLQRTEAREFLGLGTDEVEDEPPSQNWRAIEQEKEVCEVLSLVMIRPIVRDLRNEEWEDVLGEYDSEHCNLEEDIVGQLDLDGDGWEVDAWVDE
jgi:hypothetical protein